MERLPFCEKGSVVCWPFPLVEAGVGDEVGVSSDAEAEALIWGKSKMSRTEKLDVRGILISSNLEGMEITNCLDRSEESGLYAIFLASR